jgi:ATP-binding cassette subfamily F protein uup
MDIKTTWLGSKVIELHNIALSFGDKKLIGDFSYKFKRGERLGIVGANGAGKSTFLRLLTGELMPSGGKVVIGETIVFGYYTQEGIQLKEDKRVIEVIQDIAEYIPLEKGLKLTATGLLDRFLFNREQQQVYVSQLSGGEKRRLYLLTVLMKNPNFLILDEPTNDLDILTLNVLEDFLQSIYKGCLIVVTHDRYFMDKLVDHLFVFEGNGQIKDYNGNYTEYRAEKKAALKIEQAQAQSSTSTPSVSRDTRKVNDAERKEFKRLEREIGQLEDRKKELTDRFNDVSKLSAKDIEKLSTELADVQNRLEIKELRWLELADWAA